jgi:hypothetical protein
VLPLDCGLSGLAHPQHCDGLGCRVSELNSHVFGPGGHRTDCGAPLGHSCSALPELVTTVGNRITASLTLCLVKGG